MQFNDVWQPFDQLYGQAARLTPFWKSENRGLKNIILAMTVMRDDSLFLPCLVRFAFVNFSNFVQGVALNNSKSARMI